MTSNIFKKKPAVPGTGYLRHRVDSSQLEMVGEWIVVEECLAEPLSKSGIFIAHLGTQTAIRGKIVRCGIAAELDDLKVGDEIIYEAWQGGRHDLGGKKVLVMSLQNVLCKVE